MKLRLLNASHQALRYFGYLGGYRLVHEAAQDPLFRDVPARLHGRGGDADARRRCRASTSTSTSDTLIERFSNPEVRDTIARLCAESSDRIPKWLLPVVRQQLARGGEIARSAADRGELGALRRGRRRAGRADRGRRPADGRAMASPRRQREDPTAFIAQPRAVRRPRRRRALRRRLPARRSPRCTSAARGRRSSRSSKPEPRAAQAAYGSSAVTTVPAPGGLVTRSSPSSASTRSASPRSPEPRRGVRSTDPVVGDLDGDAALACARAARRRSSRRRTCRRSPAPRTRRSRARARSTRAGGPDLARHRGGDGGARRERRERGWRARTGGRPDGSRAPAPGAPPATAPAGRPRWRPAPRRGEGSRRMSAWMSRSWMASATSRCWAPSCRLRSSRRRSASPAATIRCARRPQLVQPGLRLQVQALVLQRDGDRGGDGLDQLGILVERRRRRSARRSPGRRAPRARPRARRRRQAARPGCRSRRRTRRRPAADERPRAPDRRASSPAPPAARRRASCAGPGQLRQPARASRERSTAGETPGASPNCASSTREAIPELGEHGLQLRVDRPRREEQPRGDLAVGVALGGESRHLQLLGREPRQHVLARVPLPPRRPPAARHGRDRPSPPRRAARMSPARRAAARGPRPPTGPAQVLAEEQLVRARSNGRSLPACSRSASSKLRSVPRRAARGTVRRVPGPGRRARLRKAAEHAAAASAPSLRPRARMPRPGRAPTVSAK